jgi:hypothetical protein
MCHCDQMSRVSVPDGPGPERARAWDLSPVFRDAIAELNRAVYQQSRIPLRERELVRLLVARVNQCPI